MDQLPLPLFDQCVLEGSPPRRAREPLGHDAYAHTFPGLPPEQRQPASAHWEWILTAAGARHHGVIVADGPGEAGRLWLETGTGTMLAGQFSITLADLAGELRRTDAGYVVEGGGWRLLLRLTAAEITARMDAISARAAASHAASCVFVTGARGGATMDYMTREELAAINYLRMMLPPQGEAVMAARERIRKRIGARGARPGRASTTRR